MTLQAWIGGLQYLISGETIPFLVGGSIAGLILGIIPGLSNLLGMALVLPFVFVLKSEQALPMLLGLFAGGITGGSLTAILINIPGQGTSIVTMIDGYPMTKKGEAGRALGAALTSSLIGGVLAGILAIPMFLLILPVAMSITSADMVFIILLGLSFVAALGRGSMRKGIISAGLGLAISMIGYDAFSGELRLTFSWYYLYDRVDILPLALGFFVIPEALSLMRQKKSNVDRQAAAVRIKGMRQGVLDVFRNWILVLRCTILGFVIGIIPGIGASVGQFAAYAQAKQTSKHPEKFGKGAVEGVIAPEVCNNAVEGGSLITTLALGIPGTAPCAFLLAAIMMKGIIPGPEMLTKYLDLSFYLFFCVIVANMVAAGVCFPIASKMTRVSAVPPSFLVPIILSLSFIGVYVETEDFEAVLLLCFCSLIGLAFKHFKFNIPAALLGALLGYLFEKYLFIAIAANGPLFFLRPISLALIFILVASFASKPIIRALKNSKAGKQT